MGGMRGVSEERVTNTAAIAESQAREVRRHDWRVLLSVGGCRWRCLGEVGHAAACVGGGVRADARPARRATTAPAAPVLPAPTSAALQMRIARHRRAVCGVLASATARVVGAGVAVAAVRRCAALAGPASAGVAGCARVAIVADLGLAAALTVGSTVAAEAARSRLDRLGFLVAVFDSRCLDGPSPAPEPEASSVLDLTALPSSLVSLFTLWPPGTPTSNHTNGLSKGRDIGRRQCGGPQRHGDLAAR